LDGSDATSQTFSGSNVTVWKDKSGNGYHMNTLPGNPADGTSVFPTAGTSINGLSTVKFLALAGLKQATVLDGVKNLFWVGRIAAPDPGIVVIGYFLLGHDDLIDWHPRDYGSNFLHTNYAQSGIYNASPVSLFTPDTNAVTNAVFSNVLFPSAPNVSILSAAGITGYTRFQGICYDRIYHIGWCGDLAEVITFTTALTTTQRQQVEGYLAWKWGLQSTLPAGHPYKSAAPTG
jgi:hypothetical protein